MRKIYEIAAALANENPKLCERVTWKRVQDRYKRLHQVYTREDLWNQRESGFGGELIDMDHLLSTMRKEREYIDEKREVNNIETDYIDDEK